jgi:hypothetical protein
LQEQFNALDSEFDETIDTWAGTLKTDIQEVLEVLALAK